MDARLDRLYRLLENARKRGDRATFLIVRGRIESLTDRAER